MQMKWICRFVVLALLFAVFVTPASSQQTPLDANKLYTALKTLKLRREARQREQSGDPCGSRGDYFFQRDFLFFRGN